jgi:predicted nucleic acid-binding Zn ribbon protein
LVDDSVAEATRVAGFKRRTLIVACDTQALAAELSAFRKAELLGVLDRGLGEGVVEDIRFVVEGDVGKGKGR